MKVGHRIECAAKQRFAAGADQEREGMRIDVAVGLAPAKAGDVLRAAQVEVSMLRAERGRGVRCGQVGGGAEVAINRSAGRTITFRRLAFGVGSDIIANRNGSEPDGGWNRFDSATRDQRNQERERNTTQRPW